MLNVRPNIVRTRTPDVMFRTASQIYAIQSIAQPGRTLKIQRTDGVREPLFREDLMYAANRHYEEGKVQHFCHYISAGMIRYDAEIMPLDGMASS